MRNSPQSFLIDANNYLVKNEIGEGGFGTVFLVQNKATQEEFAAKNLSYQAESKRRTN